MKYLALVGVVIGLAVACGSKNEAPVYSGGNSGSGGSFSAGGSTTSHAGTSNHGGGGHAGSSVTAAAGEGGEAGNGPTDELSPTIQITAPTAATDPTTDAPLTKDDVTVSCSVTPAAGSALLTSSIKIQMFGADGKEIGMDGAVMSGDQADEYTAHFVLNGVVPTGAVSFTCSASDQSNPPHTGSATVQTFYDGGPTITLSNPLNKSAHSLGPLLVQFSALPTPLTANDPDAAVDGVTLSVNGISITKITAIDGMPGYYQSDLDLSDAKTFTPIPVGSVPVTITATNKRGTKATGNYTFTVDSTGPLITIVSPPPVSGQIIGGLTTVQFTVTDEAGGSGVDPKTVQVTINTNAPSSYVEGANWHSADGKTFYYSFNTLEYTAQLGTTVTIDAFDLAGNKANRVSAFYYLDNVPPIIDMQPTQLQERQKSGQIAICSTVFDPLGDSPNDLDVVKSSSNFRALLWDLGNVPDGNGFEYFSDINQTNGVYLYFQSDPTKPLVKNDKGTPGGVCNEIADSSLPAIKLLPIAPAGASFFPPNAPTPGDCTDGTQSSPPDHLCNKNSALTRVIQHEVASTAAVSVIYGFAPNTSESCTGGAFDLTTVVTHDGWICASVAAKDNVGNIAVSAPIRLCLDAADSAGPGFVGTPACATGANPPTCIAVTNSCTPPPHFTQTVVTRP